MLYVEGGGDSADQKAQLRAGFDGLFKSAKELARTHGVSFRIVCAGDRNSAHGAYLNAKKNTDFALLLVDSEDEFPSNAKPIGKERIAFLTKRDGWWFPEEDAEQVHLMVRCMETWIIADAKALADFYGAKFDESQLPRRTNLEDEPKVDIQSKLRLATRNSSKGEYRKLAHASKLLSQLNADLLASKCSHFEIVMKALKNQIHEA